MPSEPARAEMLEEEHGLFLRLKREPSAIGELYDRYADRLYAFLLKRSGHKETAEDLVSQTFLKFLESLPTVEWRGVPLRALLFRIASNALVDHWRKASTRLDTDLDDAWEPPSPDDPAWNVDVKLDGERIREAMKGLPPRDQEVLHLRFDGGLETPEIAVLLEVSHNHAAVLVYRAVGRLRQRVIASRV